VHYKQYGGHFLVNTLYVDDMLFFGNIKDVIYYLKYQLSTQFDMNKFWVEKYILGKEIRKDKETRKLWLS
jgi:hypothetical protein